MGRGQILSSVIITLSIIILIGYAVGDFSLRAKGTSKASSYIGELDEMVLNSERIKSLLVQERGLALDTILYEIAGRGGYSDDWKNVPGIKTIDERYILETEIPYYYPENYPTFEEIKTIVINKIETEITTPDKLDQIKQLLDQDITIFYTYKKIDFEETENLLMVVWENMGGDLILRSSIADVSGGYIGYETTNEFKTERETPFQALYHASKQFVDTNQFSDIILEKSMDFQAVEGFRAVGKYCTDEYCSIESVDEVQSEKTFLESLDEDEQMRLLYCDLMKDEVGCDEISCNYVQRDACLMACFDYNQNNDLSSYPGCNTPQKTCEQECTEEDLLSIEYQFQCVCDDWEPVGEGGYTCQSYGWYSKKYDRIDEKYYDTNLGKELYSIINPVAESITGRNDAKTLGFTKLKDTNICKDKTYEGDSCCTQVLRPIDLASNPCSEENIGGESSCRVMRCDSTHENNATCMEDTINLKTKKLLSEELKTEGAQITRNNPEYYSYYNTNPEDWEITAKILGIEQSQIEINPTDIVYTTFLGDCETCSSGDVDTVNNSETYDFEYLKTTFSVCGETSDPCQCYEDKTIAQTGTDTNRIKESCLYYYIKKINKYVYGSTGDFQEEVDNKLSNADRNIIIFDDKECNSTIECDYDLETNDLKSICVNGLCKYCDESENTDNTRLADQIFEDTHFQRYYCNPSENKWYETTRTDGTECYEYDDPTKYCNTPAYELNLEEFPLESLCIEGESYYENVVVGYTSCSSNRNGFYCVCSSVDGCEDGSCFSTENNCIEDVNSGCECSKSVEVKTGTCKKCGEYESAVSLTKMKYNTQYKYKCLNTASTPDTFEPEWVYYGTLKEYVCYDGIDNDYDGPYDCADDDCEGQYCGKDGISRLYCHEGTCDFEIKYE